MRLPVLYAIARWFGHPPALAYRIARTAIVERCSVRKAEGIVTGVRSFRAVDHINGDPHDNRPGNLRIVDIRQNHGWITGTADVDALNGQAWRDQ